MVIEDLENRYVILLHGVDEFHISEPGEDLEEIKKSYLANKRYCDYGRTGISVIKGSKILFNKMAQ